MVDGLALAVLAQATPGRWLDVVAGAGALLVGTSMALVATTVVGVAYWAAPRMRPSGLATLLGRWALAGGGTALLLVGLILLGAGVDATANRPLGNAYSGAFSLIAWFVAARLSLLDAALTAALAQRLAERTGEALHRAACYWAVTVAIGVWVCSVLLRVAIVIVALGVVIDGVGRLIR